MTRLGGTSAGDPLRIQQGRGVNRPTQKRRMPQNPARR